MSKRNRNSKFTKLPTSNADEISPNSEHLKDTLKSIDQIRDNKKNFPQTSSTGSFDIKLVGFALIAFIGFAMIITFLPQGGVGDNLAGKSISDDLNFSIELLDGSVVSLNDYAGSKIILDLFATWCDPCKIQLEHLKIINNNYPNVVILSVSVYLKDTKDDLITYKSDHGISWIVGRDITTQAFQKYSANSIPTIAYIDKSGILKNYVQGVVTNTTLISWIT